MLNNIKFKDGARLLDFELFKVDYESPQNKSPRTS